MADSKAAVPDPVRGLDFPSRWFRNWNRLNVAGFALLMATIVRRFLAVAST